MPISRLEVRERIENVRIGWQSFQSGTLPGSAVRRSILRSWQRSAAALVDPGASGSALICCDQTLSAAIAANTELIAAATPVLADLKQLLVGTGQILVLCDSQARALLVDGEVKARSSAERINLVPGSSWHETHSGTNAMGTAQAERRRMTVLATEHYLEGLHPWACVAAPIRRPGSDEILGILDLSGAHMIVTHHTEIAVVEAVRAIEGRLRLYESHQRLALVEAFADGIAHSRNLAMLAVDRYGRPVKASDDALFSAAESAPWQEAIRTVLLGSQSLDLDLEREDGRRLTVSFRPVQRGTTVIGALAEVRVPGPGRSAKAGDSAPRALPGMIGRNPAWLAALERAVRAAGTLSTVLIAGETGTGKELVARAVHVASPRSPGPFVAVNCGALPQSLAASELFGYVGGAYTGANPRGAPGMVEAAHGGTLFLDEVSELVPEAQVSLLRVLQEREVVRVGSHRPIPVDIRVIAATNRNLAELVAAGNFRQDLFFRLNVVPITLPPLRDRREDILPLLEYGYRRLGAEIPPLGLASYDRLTAYNWPGNVRELLNLVEQAVALQEDPADLLPLPSLSTTPEPILGEAGEEERIRRALEECGGNATNAARALNMGRSTLYRKLELYGIRLSRQVN